MFNMIHSMCVKKANYIRIALKAQIERDEKRIEPFPGSVVIAFAIFFVLFFLSLLIYLLASFSALRRAAVWVGVSQSR